MKSLKEQTYTDPEGKAARGKTSRTKVDGTAEAFYDSVTMTLNATGRS